MKNSLCKAVKQDDSLYAVVWSNGAQIGEFIMDVDGFYKFWPRKDKIGYFTEGDLHAIAHCLSELNAPWDKEMNDYFYKQG